MTILKMLANRFILLTVATLLVAGCGGDTSEVLEPAEKNYAAWPELRSPVPLDPAIESRIDALLQRMTPEQKVGQVIQAEIRWVTPDDVRD